MVDTSLLPPSATSQERAFANTIARLSDVPVPIRTLYNPATCPVALLPWLAWSFSVGEWDSNWPESTKRAVIAASVAVHRIKGTKASIAMALSSAGYPDATIIEGDSNNTYDGSIQHDGRATYGTPSETNWAYYRVRLGHPISNAQAEQVKRILAATAPARCVLAALEFDAVAATYNAAINYDGTYNYGIVS
ncbi:TPA: phage tail protein I [Burkholderia vietnamiensis]|nr:phage tail protein I [Burkholderia vietnamiensis]